ncbi:MAG: 3,4-dihydroxy-2-butanone-4-phosphate synthase [Sphingomonas bacterium]|uniref:3,4-dihydroxy-2-butanone-4-phosphate synthase n=1 Tax=Sphingomonas bacterium TaxID=1895847 RepID=UPI002631D58C|nr:3,4-dihydroxy-2-butanone-4-phosphate synthase [Sphingomonas bacterium]MDB5711264.1 3,4-dihydroxy-2-butanone-4-phosphate synthase [Sphingomonas bacterium]
MKNNALSSIDEIIDEARNGRMFILVDDEDRENEGDLVIPAQMATPEAINFMAREGRGLICLSMLRSRIEELGLDLMSRENRTAFETAFTVSIEAREGVTTGISAADRARTVAVAINAANGPAEIVTPGHVFPLVARDGGVLVRAGHTEAAVDIARLAGLNPSGVICEVMNEDGGMARMDDLVAFAQRHNLKIGTIRDLIAYRLRCDHNLRKVGEARFHSMFGGDWTAVTFRNKAIDSEMLALVKGDVGPGKPTLVRMHVVDVFTDMLGVAGERHGLLQSAMAEIAREGAGVIVMITQQMPNMLTRFVDRKSDESPAVSDLDALRDYGVGAQILSALGVHDMILLTNSPRTLVALQGFALNVVGHRAMTSTPPSTWIQ